MSTKLEREFEAAKTSGDYGTNAEPGVEWLMPYPDRTFYGVDRGYGERPIFVRCLPCGKIIRYSQRAWDTFSMEHGEMCRRRGDD